MDTILDREMVDDILRKMMLAFQYKPSSRGEYEKTLELYYSSFIKSNMKPKQVIDTAGRLIFSWKPEYGRKFPTVKEFIDLAGVSPSSIAEKAHRVLKTKILKVGGYEPLDLGKEHKHFVAMEAIRKMGGWFAVCQQGIEQWDKNKNRFSKLFEDLYYEKVPHKPLLCGSDLKNQEFLAEYNKNQIENN